AESRDPFFHAEDSEPAAVGRVLNRRHVKPAAVVLNDGVQVIRLLIEDQADAGGGGVPENIGQCLLNHAVEGDFKVVGETPAVNLAAGELDRDAAQFRPLSDVLLQHGAQPEVVNRRG